ncbi:MAG: acyl carrier protein [Bacteroidetes bacterium]|nr:MAG: acyl carrier protein [Bacteroidota bacterium]
MTKNNNELTLEIAQLLIDSLNITHVEAKDVNITTPLFSEENELELDSVDAIEIVVAIQRAYGIRINSELPTREILNSIQSIADFLIKENATEKVA